MIKEIKRKALRGKLTIEIETQLKQFLSEPRKILSDEEVLKIANEKHEILEMISRPVHEVGNFTNSSTKQFGVWVFKLKPKPPKKNLTSSSIRGKISKIAKDLNEQNE